MLPKCGGGGVVLCVSTCSMLSNTNNSWATASRGKESPTTRGQEWEDIAIETSTLRCPDNDSVPIN